MRKIIILSGIILFFSVSLCFAQQESLTITTYYPSPYGSYNQLYVADKLGIGKVDPQVKLDVQNSAGASIIDTKGTGDTWNYAGLRIWSDETTDKHWALWHKKTNNFVIEEFNGTSYFPRFVIIPGGDVAIGTGTPTAGFKLDVIGNVRCQSLTQYSSRKYKKDIQLLDPSDYSNILEKLKQTKVYRFRYKEAGKDSKLKIGLIAEEAPEEIVSQEGKGIDIGEAVGFLVAAVKAQAEEIKVLKQEISRLKGIK